MRGSTDLVDTAEEPKGYTEKHLARNVPVNFSDCCDRIRRDFARREGEAARRGRSIKFDDIYRGMIQILVDEEVPADFDEIVGDLISEVEVRYQALALTVDFSVPTKPIYEALEGLWRSVRRATQRIEDEERRAVLQQLPPASDAYVEDEMEAFRNAQNLAERVTVAEDILCRFERQLDEMVKFFDYKSGLSVRGKPSRYAFQYAVMALADIFEEHNEFGRRANVGETVNTRRNVGDMDSINARRYTGKFLQFVSAFFREVDAGEVQRRQREGFEDSVRKAAQQRRKDPSLYKLLNDDVTPEVLLGFMKRADALK